MSSSPFYDGTVPFAGEQPTDLAPWNDWSSRRFWIGKGAAMYEFPNPNVAAGYSATDDQGRAVDKLYGGGSAVTVFDGLARTWQYGWERLAPREWQLLAALNRARPPFGAGPYIYLPIEDTNRLTCAQSLCGALEGTVDGWAATGGTVATNTAAPAILGGGTMRWAPSGAGVFLAAGAVSSGVPVPDLDYALPYIPAEPLTFSVWVWTLTSAAQVAAVLRGCDDVGNIPLGVTDQPSATLTTTSTPQLLSVSIDPGALGSAKWALPLVKSVDGSAFRMSNPQVSLTTAPVGWEQGTGAPRVNPTAELAPTLDANLNRAATLALGEAFPGAA